MDNRFKEFTGEKYIYLNMAYRLAKENGGKIKIGNDNGYRGGQNFERWFSIQEYIGDIILRESKTSAGFANFSREFLIVDMEDSKRVRIYPYYNEDNENCSKKWVH